MTIRKFVLLSDPDHPGKDDYLVRYWQPKLRSVASGTWLQFDGSRRIAVIRQVEKSNPPRPLLRAETWAPNAADRELIGYFPADELRLAAECVWDEYQAALSVKGKEPKMVSANEAGVQWHPLLNADERTPGIWTMVDSTGRPYGAVRIMRESGAVVYVGELRGEPLGGRNVRLREATERVHQAYVASARSDLPTVDVTGEVITGSAGDMHTASRPDRTARGVYPT